MRSEHDDRLDPRDGEFIASEPAIAGSGEHLPEHGRAERGKPAVVEEVLIEEVSIDGMCGVY